MPRVGFNEAVFQPFPEDGSIPELAQELILHMGVRSIHDAALVNALGGVGNDVDSLK